ncbi:hypothetical protein Syun_022100 [Stephania yunnanensis]|uniref:Uncharacterized protein n=1 Tax=Stephania yunnanensis TaxID=152371 RepID=A0AAP0IH02_9MAGN
MSSSSIDVRRGKTLVFCFWVALIFTHLCPCCAVRDEERWSSSSTTSTLPRRVLLRFLDLSSTVASNSVVVSSEATSKKSGGDGKDEGVLFEDEKRKIHTGPNPLHN